MRKSRTATDTVTANTTVFDVHPLEMQSQDDILEAYIAATARFVKACGYAPNEWRIVQIWARKTKLGYGNDIRVSVNGEYIGETERPMK